jgi:hypothetical protein
VRLEDPHDGSSLADYSIEFLSDPGHLVHPVVCTCL